MADWTYGCMSQTTRKTPAIISGTTSRGCAWVWETQWHFDDGYIFNPNYTSSGLYKLLLALVCGNIMMHSLLPRFTNTNRVKTSSVLVPSHEYNPIIDPDDTDDDSKRMMGMVSP